MRGLIPAALITMTLGVSAAVAQDLPQTPERIEARIAKARICNEVELLEYAHSEHGLLLRQLSREADEVFTEERAASQEERDAFRDERTSARDREMDSIIAQVEKGELDSEEAFLRFLELIEEIRNLDGPPILELKDIRDFMDAESREIYDQSSEVQAELEIQIEDQEIACTEAELNLQKLERAMHR